MKRYGVEAPWSGYSPLGRWRKGRLLWDGGFEWEYVPPPSRAAVRITDVASILKETYLPFLTHTLNQSVFVENFSGGMNRKVPLSRAAQHAKWKRLPWWRRLVTPRPA